MAASALWFAGVRLSTWLTAGAFLAVFFLRGDGRAILAGWAWITGFEVAYQFTALLMGTSDNPTAVPYLMAPGIIIVPYLAWRQKIIPSWGWMTVAGLVWIAWILAGFHANGWQGGRINMTTEVLNESAKTAWAVAYIWPLLRYKPAADRLRDGVRRRLRMEPIPGVLHMPVHGAAADTEKVADHRFGEPVREVAEHLELPRRQRVTPRRVG